MTQFIRLSGTSYSIPDNIKQNSEFAHLLRLNKKSLSEIDKGDPLNSNSADNQPKDHHLGKIELLEYLTGRYELILSKAAKKAVNNDLKGWEAEIKQLNETAKLFDELGYTSKDFHADYSQGAARNYYLRMIKLVQSVPELERKKKDFFNKVYTKALTSCQQGGLGLKTPSADNAEKEILSTSDFINSCEENNPKGWGYCINQTSQTALLILSASAVYSSSDGEEVKLQSLSISNHPFDVLKNSFTAPPHIFFAIGFKNQMGGTTFLDFDPSNIGFKFYPKFPRSYFLNPNVWRSFIADHQTEKAINSIAKGNLTEAQELLREAVELRPHSLGFFNLAKALNKKGAYAEAIKLLNQALLREPENSTIQVQLGINYLYLQQFEETEKIDLKLVSSYPTDPHLWSNYGITLLMQGKDQLAFQAFNRSMQLNSDSLTIAVAGAIGLIHIYRKDPTNLLKKYIESLQYEPTQIRVSIGAGMIDFTNKRYASARRYFQEVVENQTAVKEEKEFAEEMLRKINTQFPPKVEQKGCSWF